MRIGIDYTAAARQGGGIGRYARELVGAILASGHAHTFALMAASGGLGDRWRAEQTRLRRLVEAPDRLSFRSLPITDNWMARLWQRLRLPLPAEWVAGRIDAFYSPDFVLPPLHRKTPAILTVHDLSFRRHPETFTAPLLRYLETAVPRSVARADHILADSEATRQDLITLMAVPPERVTVLYSGVSQHFGPEGAPEERARLIERYGVGKRPYVLSVGTVQPRKNYVRLMEACDALAPKENVALVIVGRPAWLAEPIVAAAKQRPYVHLLGFVEEADLPALYRQAEIFAFPSLYEGFGIPPLEAMACGVPVVASSASSVPEVVGDAGLLLDPTAVPAWTAALQALLDSGALRADLRARGRERVRQFTWERAATVWWEVIHAQL
ncbi:MAG: glycosyltransferase family 4 protein [Anaerolineae bacterium]|nr:glycosyltransferase family 4 protein [Anaerolineae bacterium]